MNPVETLATIKTTFGERVGIARDRAGLQALQVAKAIGSSHTSIRNWERGHGGPKPDQLVALARVLGVTVDWLLQGEPVPTEGDVTERGDTSGSHRSTNPDYSAEPFAGWDWAMAA